MLNNIRGNHKRTLWLRMAGVFARSPNHGKPANGYAYQRKASGSPSRMTVRPAHCRLDREVQTVEPDVERHYIKGKARIGVFNTGPNVRTMDFNPGDIGYVPRNYGHYVENIGDTDVQFFGVFRTSQFKEFSLSDFLRHSPPEMVEEHLNVDPATVSQWPGFRAGIMPE